MMQMRETIDPAGVPRFTLASGAQIPVIGLGTVGSDKVSADEIAAAVLEAEQQVEPDRDCRAGRELVAVAELQLRAGEGVSLPLPDEGVHRELVVLEEGVGAVQQILGLLGARHRR